MIKITRGMWIFAHEEHPRIFKAGAVHDTHCYNQGKSQRRSELIDCYPLTLGIDGWSAQTPVVFLPYQDARDKYLRLFVIAENVEATKVSNETEYGSYVHGITKCDIKMPRAIPCPNTDPLGKWKSKLGITTMRWNGMCYYDCNDSYYTPHHALCSLGRAVKIEDGIDEADLTPEREYYHIKYPLLAGTE